MIRTQLLAAALVALVDERKGAPLMTRITGIRRQLSKELGFVIPAVKVSDDLSLPGNVYRISVAGVIVGEDDLTAHLLAQADQAGIEILDDVDVVHVVDAHLAYFEAIGAVGPKAIDL